MFSQKELSSDEPVRNKLAVAMANIGEVTNIDALKSQMKGGSYNLYCMFDKGSLVGYATFMPDSEDSTYGYLNKIAIHSEHRGKGFAKRMLMAIQEDTEGFYLTNIIPNQQLKNAMTALYLNWGLFKKMRYFIGQKRKVSFCYNNPWLSQISYLKEPRIYLIGMFP